MQAAISRIHSGIPKTTTTSTDPPHIPTFIEQVVRVRYGISTVNAFTTGEFQIVPPRDAWRTGNINLYLKSPPLNEYQIHLDHEDIYDAAAIRVFGSSFTEASILANPVIRDLKAETEFSVQSVTAWGTSFIEFASPITLAVDFANGTPGIVLTDDGTRGVRAVCKAVNSRLNWEMYGMKSPTDAFIVLKIGFNNFPSAVYTDAGVIDCVVRVRRSFNAIVTPSSKIVDNNVDIPCLRSRRHRHHKGKESGSHHDKCKSQLIHKMRSLGLGI